MEEGEDLVGLHFDQAIRLPHVAGDFGNELVRRYSGRGSQLSLVANARLDLPGNLLSRAEEALTSGHVEERFIQRQRFDQRSERPQNRKNLTRDLDVALPSRRHHDRLWTELR